MTRSSTIRLNIMITIIWFLASCSSKPSTIITDTSCLPPCWQGITPGLSTVQEVLSILPNVPGVDPKSIVDASTVIYDTSIYCLFERNARDIGGRIYFKNNVVAAIDIAPKDKALTFRDAVDKLGSPENVLAVYSKGEREWLSIFIIYQSKGFALLDNIVPFHKGEHAEIKASRPVVAVYYFDPVLFDELMTNSIIANWESNIIQKGMQPWTGFGEITYIER